MARRFTLIAFVILAALGASSDYEIVQDIASSGGQAANSADYAITATVGQPTIGLATSADYSLCHGVWCADAAEQPGIPIPGTNGARLIYSITFGEMAIAAVALALLSVVLARNVFDWIRKAA
jgi:hypothetical protein